MTLQKTKTIMLVVAIICVLLAMLAALGAFVLPDKYGTVSVQQAASTKAIPAEEYEEPEPIVLGTATTSFSGSSLDRQHNIALGAERVSSITVAPGEEYSFLEHLGVVTEEVGYKEEYVIAYGSTRKEAGGGICQVSTTMFRAVVDAGLPVTQRHGHGYVVGYYGPGLDATIYGPWRDLKWINDTEYPITVQSVVEGTDINFSILGFPDGRTSTTTAVKFSDIQYPPKPVYISDFSLELGKEWCTERAITGMTTEVTYTIEKSDGTVLEQLFETEYKPWGKKCYMGVKMPLK